MLRSDGSPLPTLGLGAFGFHGRERHTKLEPAADHGRMLGFHLPKLTKPVRDVRLHEWFEGCVLFHGVVSRLSVDLEGS